MPLTVMLFSDLVSHIQLLWKLLAYMSRRPERISIRSPKTFRRKLLLASYPWLQVPTGLDLN